MNRDLKKEWARLKRLLFLFPCAYFVFATYKLTPSNPNFGFMAALGVNWALLAWCVLGFVPAVGFFFWFHYLLRKDSVFRRYVDLITGLGIWAILSIHLAFSLPYDAERETEFSGKGAIILKSIVGPPGSVDSLTEDESTLRQTTPPDPESVMIAFGVGLTLLGLAVWDILLKRQDAKKSD